MGVPPGFSGDLDAALASAKGADGGVCAFLHLDY